MNTKTEIIGTRIDAHTRDYAQLPLIAPDELHTVQDLLTAIQELRPTLPVPMLRTTAGHVSRCLNLPLERLTIAELLHLAPRFRKYLHERKYKEKSVRSYANFLATLLRTAKELGWKPQDPEVPEEWEPILRAMRTHLGCGGIIHYAIHRKKLPAEFSDNDLNAWGQEFLSRGRSYEYMVGLKSKFRRALLRSGLEGHLPALRCRPQYLLVYGVPLRFLPTHLRREVEDLLKWKQALYAEGRPRRGRHRAITAKHLEECISRLFGFLTKVKHRKNVTTLIQLVTKELLGSFISWNLNERGVKGEPLAGNLGVLYAAMKWNPRYKAKDFTWFSRLLLGNSARFRIRKKAAKSKQVSAIRGHRAYTFDDLRRAKKGIGPE